MRKLFAVAALLLLPVVVWAAVEARDGVKIVNQGTNASPIKVMTADTVYYNLRGTATGSAYIEDAAPDRNQVWTATVINNKLGRCGADSGVVNTTGWKYMALDIYTTYAGGDTTDASAIAIMISGSNSFNADTSNTVLWRMWRRAAITDTMGTLAATNGVYSLYTPTGGIAYNTTTAPNCNWLPGEKVYLSSRYNPDYGWAKGYRILLSDDLTGDWWSAAYTKIRVRVLWSAGSTSAGGETNANKAVGRGTTTNGVGVKCVLVGWR